MFISLLPSMHCSGSHWCGTIHIICDHDCWQLLVVHSSFRWYHRQDRLGKRWWLLGDSNSSYKSVVPRNNNTSARRKLWNTVVNLRLGPWRNVLEPVSSSTLDQVRVLITSGTKDGTQRGKLIGKCGTLVYGVPTADWIRRVLSLFPKGAALSKQDQ